MHQIDKIEWHVSHDHAVSQLSRSSWLRKSDWHFEEANEDVDEDHYVDVIVDVEVIIFEWPQIQINKISSLGTVVTELQNNVKKGAYDGNAKKERASFLPWIERVLQRPTQINEHQTVKHQVRILKYWSLCPTTNNVRSYCLVRIHVIINLLHSVPPWHDLQVPWPRHEFCQHHCIENCLLAQVVVKDGLSNAGPTHQRIRVLVELLVQQNEAAHEAQREHRYQLRPEKELEPDILTWQVIECLNVAGGALDTHSYVLTLLLTQQLFVLYIILLNIYVLQKLLVKWVLAADILGQQVGPEPAVQFNGVAVIPWVLGVKIF